MSTQMTLEELIENFSFLDNWEDKYRYLIELGDQLPSFNEEDKIDLNKVDGCMSQVWFVHKQEGDKHFFNATSDAHIVRGLEAVLLTLINGKTSQEIQNLNLIEIFKQLGLESHLSPTRRNGFYAMVERILTLSNSK